MNVLAVQSLSCSPYMCLLHPCQWQNFVNTITFSFLRLRHLFIGKWAFPAYSQYNMEGKETLQCFRSLWFSTQNHLHILRWPVMYHTLTDILHWNISLLTNSYPDYISSTFCCCMYMNVKRIKFGWSIVF